MNEPTLLRFGSCELNLPQRELRVHGVAQALPPKVHDLLALLLRQRQRVLPKRELVATLWQRESVSDGVLANTVMQARRAIGDTTTPPQWIKTVHGIGYRFVGEVFESAAERDTAAALLPAASEAPLGAPRRRIGVLPCANHSGDPTLDWAQLGLMSLVSHALESDARLAVVPAATLLDAVSRLAPGTLASEQASLSMRALGLQHAVMAVLRSQGAALWLDYQVHGADGSVFSGNLRDTDAVALGQRLAHAIEEALFPGRVTSVPFESRDAFVNQAFARGMELHKQEQWDSAAHLFAVVCDMEPASTAARLWQVRALVLGGHASAQARAQSLLAHAQALGDTRLQAATHDVLGFALMTHAEGSASHVAAQQHSQAALRLTEGHDHEDWAIKIQLRAAIAAQAAGQSRQALAMYERAETSCRAIGYSVGLGLIQTNAAVVEVAACNLIGAKQRLEEALRLTREAGSDAAATHALCDLAEVNAALGLLDLATTQVQQALAALDRLQSAPAAVTVALVAVQVLGERGVTFELERALAKVAHLATDPRPAVRSMLLAAQGWLARCQGDITGASQHLQDALALSRSPGALAESRRTCARLLLRVQVAAGSGAAAARLRQHLAQEPTWREDLELQGSALHAEAAECLLRGDAAAALAALASVIDQVPFSRPHACARLDAAWLHAQRGDAARAARLLAGAGAWCKEHPAGLAAQARVHWAQGQVAEAAAAQQRALQMFNGSVPPWHAALLHGYRASAPAASLPGLPCLVSDSWMPQAPPA